MFEVKDQLFRETPVNVLGRVERLSDAVKLAESHLQIGVNIWVEREGRRVCGYDDLEASVAPDCSN